jgi:hypothetical protein
MHGSKKKKKNYFDKQGTFGTVFLAVPWAFVQIEEALFPG